MRAESPPPITSLEASPTLVDLPSDPVDALVDPDGSASDVFLERIPRDFARDHLIISCGRVVDSDGAPARANGDADFDDGTTEHLLVAESTSPAVVHNVRVRIRCNVRTVIADGELIARRIDEAYQHFASRQNTEERRDTADLEHAPQDAAANVAALLEQSDKDLLTTEGKGPIIRLVDSLLFEGLGLNASDMHIQPLPDRALVRFRVDGMLHDVHTIPRHAVAAVTSRIKVMGRMDIAERRVPQDGRASITIGKRPIDLRISTLPTSYGERTVIRLLDNSQRLCDLDELGMPAQITDAFLEQTARSHGMILVTGPTGSGKTTTLYATLKRICSQFTNLMTIEDPIEYELSTVGLAISQSQVNNKKGVTFATGLRHILRQDPDVIMVGEIRDAETARIAIQSSMTGHLVFSTLHTNDAASAVTRLIDLGVEPFLVSASLSAVLAQRLVRRVHAACGGHGCQTCLGTGLKGRCGLFELLVVSDDVRHLINHRPQLSDLRLAAAATGMRTLFEAGCDLVTQGVTTRGEVARVAQDLSAEATAPDGSQVDERNEE